MEDFRKDLHTKFNAIMDKPTYKHTEPKYDIENDDKFRTILGTVIGSAHNKFEKLHDAGQDQYKQIQNKFKQKDDDMVELNNNQIEFKKLLDAHEAEIDDISKRTRFTKDTDKREQDTRLLAIEQAMRRLASIIEAEQHRGYNLQDNVGIIPNNGDEPQEEKREGNLTLEYLPTSVLNPHTSEYAPQTLSSSPVKTIRSNQSVSSYDDNENDNENVDNLFDRFKMENEQATNNDVEEEEDYDTHQFYDDNNEEDNVSPVKQLIREREKMIEKYSTPQQSTPQTRYSTSQQSTPQTRFSTSETTFRLNKPVDKVTVEDVDSEIQDTWDPYEPTEEEKLDILNRQAKAEAKLDEQNMRRSERETKRTMKAQLEEEAKQKRIESDNLKYYKEGDLKVSEMRSIINAFYKSEAEKKTREAVNGKVFKPQKIPAHLTADMAYSLVMGLPPQWKKKPKI